MLKENLEKIFNDVKSGNNLGEQITVVGATKTVSVDVINHAIDLGLRVVAENRVQEFNSKHGQIIGAEEHFIGRLQTNKVKYLVGKVELIHSVDSIRLAEEINRQAEKKGVVQDILIEINVSGESTKGGFSVLETENAVKFITDSFKSICVKGLMTMLPHTDDKEQLSKLSKTMRELYDSLKSQGLPFQYLSMGMSNDYLTAIQNGSNMIRLGNSIFGERNYGEK